MIKPLDKPDWECRLLALDVKGKHRIVVENHRDAGGAPSPLTIFGIKWQ